MSDSSLGATKRQLPTCSAASRNVSAPDPVLRRARGGISTKESGGTFDELCFRRTRNCDAPWAIDTSSSRKHTWLAKNCISGTRGQGTLSTPKTSSRGWLNCPSPYWAAKLFLTNGCGYSGTVSSPCPGRSKENRLQDIV